MVLRSALILFGIIVALQVRCQQLPGTFPAMETRTLGEETVQLPSDVMGKYTLLGLAFSRRSEDDLLSWFGPVYEKFVGDKSGSLTRLFAQMTYNVNVYFVPMFTGINTPATKPAMRRALEKIDPRLHPHILFYKGQLRPYKEALNFRKKDIPYLYLSDAKGAIVYATSGSYSHDKMRLIEKALE